MHHEIGSIVGDYLFFKFFKWPCSRSKNSIYKAWFFVIPDNAMNVTIIFANGTFLLMKLKF